MESKKAEEYLNRCHKPGNANMKEKKYSREMCNKAVEIGEKELKEKALKAFCEAVCPKGIRCEKTSTSHTCKRVRAFLLLLETTK